MSEKVAQCRYCVNSSNEGKGIWLRELWICMPCFVRFETQRFSDILKKEIEEDTAQELLNHLIEEHWERNQVAKKWVR